MSWTHGSGRAIWFDVQGDGPPLVLLHGGAASHEVWEFTGYVDALNREHTLVLPDARGHGRSERPPEVADYAYRRHAADVLAVLDALAISRATIVGFSMGGSTALALGALHPSRVTGVVAVDSAVDDVGFDDYTVDMPDDWSLPVEIAQNGLGFAVDSLEAEGRGQWAELFRRADASAFERQVEAWRSPEPLGVRLADLSVPSILILSGSTNRAALPLLPAHVRVQHIEGADHVGVLESIDDVIGAIRAVAADGTGSR